VEDAAEAAGVGAALAEAVVAEVSVDLAEAPQVVAEQAGAGNKSPRMAMLREREL